MKLRSHNQLDKHKGLSTVKFCCIYFSVGHDPKPYTLNPRPIKIQCLARVAVIDCRGWHLGFRVWVQKGFPWLYIYIYTYSLTHIVWLKYFRVYLSSFIVAPGFHSCLNLCRSINHAPRCSPYKAIHDRNQS